MGRDTESSRATDTLLRSTSSWKLPPPVGVADTGSEGTMLSSAPSPTLETW